MGNPKILNLDEVEGAESDITIVHVGIVHSMRVLTVDMFIDQQKRQRKHEAELIKASESEEDGGDIYDAVQMMRDSILDFFPTLPVGDLPTPKLFQIFVWLNEVSNKINEEVSAEAIAETAEDVGNAPALPAKLKRRAKSSS